MLNRRIIVMVGVGIAIVILAAVVYFIFTGSNAGTGSSAGGPPPGQSLTIAVDPSLIPPGDTVTIGTSQGIVTVNNFYKTAVGMEENTIILAQDPSYAITYDRASAEFSITGSGRAAAEAKFLQILGVSKSDACKLYSGLSFCIATQ